MDRTEEGEVAIVADPGEHDIDAHPHLARRMLMAAGVALGLFILGLMAEAHATTPPLTPAGASGPLVILSAATAQG
jgi:hypothetical protein